MMLNKLIKYIYQKLPSSLVKRIGKSSILQPFRELILRYGKNPRIIEVNVSWEGFSFIYKGDIKSAIKAERKGIEGSLLRLSFELLKKRRIGNNDFTIVDVGSSYGFLSTVWGLYTSANSRIYSFEASKTVSETFRETIAKNNLQKKIILENKAVYNIDGLLALNNHDGTHSTVSNESFSSTTKLECIKLDSYFTNINVDLIKIDVDGPELEVLEGASEILKTFKPILIVETNYNSDIVNYLEKFDYSFYSMVMKPYKKGDELPPNLIAI
jgi:FkbM family methyltransferase